MYLEYKRVTTESANEGVATLDEGMEAETRAFAKWVEKPASVGETGANWARKSRIKFFPFNIKVWK